MEPIVDNTENNTKKKRGRKPKSVVVTQPETSVPCDTNGQEQEQEPVPDSIVEKPPHKKRGRKPKGGKIVTDDPIPVKHEITKKNVILHLKCNMKDIHNTNDIFSDNIEDKSNHTQYHVINGDHNGRINNRVGGCDTIDKSARTENNVIDGESSISREISSKLSELQKLFHTNDISDKKSACFWCTYNFDNPAVYIPKHKIQNSYQVYGCFCSPECATSHLYSENLDTSVKFERYQLINYIYSKVYEYKVNIKPAPNPYYLLDKYFGNLSIGEYRKLLRNDRLLMVIDKPLTRVLPELHEETNNFMTTTHNEPSNTSIYKVKKKSINPTTKNSILNENFGVSVATSNF